MEAKGIQLERQWVNIYLGKHYDHTFPVWTCSVHTSKEPILCLCDLIFDSADGPAGGHH